MPRILAAILAVTIVVAAFVGFLAVVTPALVAQLVRVFLDLPSAGRLADAGSRVQDWLATLPEVSVLLGKLEQRLKAFPAAAAYDVGSARLDVARALAGNSRAMLHLGGAGDVAEALVMRTLTEERDAMRSDTPGVGSPPAP